MVRTNLQDLWVWIFCFLWAFFVSVIYRECICPVITPYTGPNGFAVIPSLNCLFLGPREILWSLCTSGVWSHQIWIWMDYGDGDGTLAELAVSRSEM
jgi:hypothetical protein